MLKASQEHARRAAATLRAPVRLPLRCIADIPLVHDDAFTSPVPPGFADVRLVEIPDLKSQETHATAPLQLPSTATCSIAPVPVYYIRTSGRTRDVGSILNAEFARLAAELGLAVYDQGADGVASALGKVARDISILQSVAASVRACMPGNALTQRFASAIEQQGTRKKQAILDRAREHERGATPVDSFVRMTVALLDWEQTGDLAFRHRGGDRETLIRTVRDAFGLHLPCARREGACRPHVGMGITLGDDEYATFQNCAVLNEALAEVRSWNVGSARDEITYAASVAKERDDVVAVERSAAGDEDARAHADERIVRACVAAAKTQPGKVRHTNQSRFDAVVDTLLRIVDADEEEQQRDDATFKGRVIESVRASGNRLALQLLDEEAGAHEAVRALLSGGKVVALEEEPGDTRGVAPSNRVSSDRALCGPASGTGPWRIRDRTFVACTRPYGDGTIFAFAQHLPQCAPQRTVAYALQTLVYPRSFHGTQYRPLCSTRAPGDCRFWFQHPRLTVGAEAVLPAPYVPERSAEIQFNGVTLADAVSPGPRFPPLEEYGRRVKHVVRRVTHQGDAVQPAAGARARELGAEAACVARSKKLLLSNTFPAAYAVQNQRREYGSTMCEFSTPLLQVRAGDAAPTPRASPAVMSCSYEPACAVIECTKLPLSLSRGSGVPLYAMMFTDAAQALANLHASVTSGAATSAYADEQQRSRPCSRVTLVTLGIQCILDNLMLATGSTRGYSGVRTAEQLLNLCDALPLHAIEPLFSGAAKLLRESCAKFVALSHTIPSHAGIHHHRDKEHILSVAYACVEALRGAIHTDRPTFLATAHALSKLDKAITEASATTTLVADPSSARQVAAALGVCGHIAALVDDVKQRFASVVDAAAGHGDAVGDARKADEIASSTWVAMQQASLKCGELLGFGGHARQRVALPSSAEFSEEIRRMHDRTVATSACVRGATRYVCDRAYWVAVDYLHGMNSYSVERVNAAASAVMQFDVEQLTLHTNGPSVFHARLEDIVTLVAYEVSTVAGPVRVHAGTDQGPEVSIPSPVLMQYLWNMSLDPAVRTRTTHSQLLPVSEQAAARSGLIRLPLRDVDALAGPPDASNVYTLDAEQWGECIALFLSRIPDLCSRHFRVDDVHRVPVDSNAESPLCAVSVEVLGVGIRAARELIARARARPDASNTPAEINTYATILCRSALSPYVPARDLRLAQLGQADRERALLTSLGAPSYTPQAASATYEATRAIRGSKDALGGMVTDSTLRQSASLLAAAAEDDFESLTTLVPGMLKPAFTEGLVTSSNVDCSYYVAYALRSSLPCVVRAETIPDLVDVVRSYCRVAVTRLMSLGGGHSWPVMLTLHRVALQAWWMNLSPADAAQMPNAPSIMNATRVWDKSTYEGIVLPLVDEIMRLSTASDRRQHLAYDVIERFSAACAYGVVLYVSDCIPLPSTNTIVTLAALVVAATAVDVLVEKAQAADVPTSGTPTTNFADLLIVNVRVPSGRSSADGAFLLPDRLHLPQELRAAIFSVPSADWKAVCVALCDAFTGCRQAHSFSYVAASVNTTVPAISEATQELQRVLAVTKRAKQVGMSTFATMLSPCLAVVYIRLAMTAQSPAYEHREQDLQLCKEAWVSVSAKMLKTT